MKFIRLLIFYTTLILLFGGIIFYILHAGKSKNHFVTHTEIRKESTHKLEILPDLFRVNLHEALPRLLLQIFFIIAATQLLGWLFKKIGQPAVIGETMAGIILGPSLLGLLFPGTFHFLFPVESLPNLQFLSQIGLILFMFIIGMELDTQLVRKQAFEALIISHASILIPFSMGIFLSYYLYESYGQTNFTSFALFMGIAMSITAFPVLARIIRDRKLTGTRLGNLAISSAASDDVTAWCILAVLIALIRSGSGINGLFIVVVVILYIIFMLVPVRLILLKVQIAYEKEKVKYSGLMAIMFTLLLLSAWCTEVIGIHALFGAFLAGIVVPKGESIKKKMIDRISDISLVMLLPLFFVYTGLRTNAAILNSPGLWLSFGMILICAVAGKLGASTVVAKALGETWKDSLSIGALMNTRGLMELIVLNIGLDMGILSSEIFSMMVLMALLTTMMTNPILNWIEKKESCNPLHYQIKLKFHKYLQR